MDLIKIQSALTDQKLDGWLFFDHHHRDEISYRILNLSTHQHVSRRWYYLIPAKGDPKGLVHSIEHKNLSTLPGSFTTYSEWKEHRDKLQKMLQGMQRIAMQYSPFCSIPYVSNVDAGTVELIRSFSIEVTSSAELIQYFEAKLTEDGINLHLKAGTLVDSILKEAFQMIAEKTRNKSKISEWDVKSFILERFQTSNLFTDYGPCVAVNSNSGLPHYDTTYAGSSDIKRGDFVLIDLWAKLNVPDGVYYDITWVAVCDETVKPEIQNVFTVVKGARDATINKVKEVFRLSKPIKGFELDDISRKHISEQGYGKFFIHRTGHSIGRNTHGNGANLDNFECHDDRTILPESCFSIEPGIYLNEFGIRLEVNMITTRDDAYVTGEIQNEIVLL
jgi:Xaa-Pro dipeptidase